MRKKNYMEIIVVPRAEKKIKKLQNKIKEAVREVIDELGKFPFTRLDIKKLKGKKNVYRIRKGKYRVLFICDGQKIYIVDIEIRGRVYG